VLTLFDSYGTKKIFKLMKLLLLLCSLVAVFAQDEKCHSTHADKTSCDADSSCSWCDARAVPSACYSKEDAKRLPSAVFQCDSQLLVSIDSVESEEVFSIEVGGTLEPNDEEGLCDPDVGQIAGYFHLGNQNKDYFFWFFESRRDPANDPVILWMTGGPGCSRYVFWATYIFISSDY